MSELEFSTSLEPAKTETQVTSRAVVVDSGVRSIVLNGAYSQESVCRLAAIGPRPPAVHAGWLSWKIVSDLQSANSIYFSVPFNEATPIRWVPRWHFPLCTFSRWLVKQCRIPRGTSQTFSDISNEMVIHLYASCRLFSHMSWRILSGLHAWKGVRHQHKCALFSPVYYITFQLFFESTL